MIGKHRPVLTALVSTFALLASPGFAQQVPPAGVPQPATPPGWLLVPTIGVAEVWDDNVSLVGDASSPSDDYVTAVSPTLAIDYRGRKTTLGINYVGIYDFYQDLSQFNSANQRAHLEFNQRLSPRVSMFARDNFSLSPTTEDVQLAGLVLRRRTSRFNDFRGGLEVTLNKRTTLTAAYTSQWINFADDDSVSPLLRGGYSNGGSAELKRVLSPRVSIGANYDYQQAVVSQGSDEFDIQDTGAFIELALTRMLTATAEGGYAWLSPGRTQPSRDAPTFRVGLVLQARRALFDLTYGRAFLPSFGFGGTIQNEELSGTFRMPLARRLEWSGGASWRENDPLTPGETSLRSVFGHTSIVFLATRWLKVEVFGTHASQDSRVAGGQISRTRAGIQLATSRSVRVR